MHNIVKCHVRYHTARDVVSFWILRAWNSFPFWNFSWKNVRVYRNWFIPYYILIRILGLKVKINLGIFLGINRFQVNNIPILRHETQAENSRPVFIKCPKTSEIYFCDHLNCLVSYSQAEYIICSYF